MFLEHGFELTTIEAVAARVNMTKRTVYARYEDKAELFKAAVRRAIERTIVPRETLDALDDGDLEGTLARFARMRVAHVMTPEGMRLQRVVNTESYRFPEIFTWSYEDGAGPAISFLTDLLRRYESLGQIHVGRPEMVAGVFMSMVVGGIVRSLLAGVAPSQDEIDDRTSFAVRLFLNGARPRKGSL